MKVFVAGASGTLGSQVVRELVGRGHEVVGMTRHESRRRLLEERGAEAAVGDALDGDSVQRVVRSAEPEAVISVLTSLPRTGPKRVRDLEPTNRLRDEGTRNVLAAAVDAGARRYVGESIIAVYGYHVDGEPATEDRPPGHERNRGLQRAISAILSAERQMREAADSGRIESVALRFGFYHGADTPSCRYMFDMARRRLMPMIGGGHAVHSWIDIGDAARAAADALERADSGSVFNVVDDEPAPASEWLPYLAECVGAKPPMRVPKWLARPLAGDVAVTMMTEGRGFSNVKAKRELGWELRYPSWRQGFKDGLT